MSHYMIAGRQVQTHWISIGVLGSAALLGLYASSGKKKGPAINAQNPSEEQFIKDYLKKAEEKLKT